MNSYQRGIRKSENQPDGVPVNKKPRVVSTGTGTEANGFPTDDDDDPFADDITGEEWEFAASQAELRHLEQSKKKVNNGRTSYHSKIGASNAINEPKLQAKISSDQSDSKLIADLKSKLSVYETQIHDLKSSFNNKNGETLILRDRLTNTEKQLHQEKIKMIELQSCQEKQNSEREKFTQKQIEKCKDEVQFKQAELQESQNLIRNLEAKIKALQQQNATLKSRSPNKPTNNVESLAGAGGWSDTQHMSNSSVSACPKKIKLVKPESPRISSGKTLRAEFTDAPFEKSAKVSLSPIKNLSETRNQAAILATLKQTQGWKLTSEILHLGSRGQSIMQNMVGGDNMVATEANIPSFFHTICSAGFKSTLGRTVNENLKRYLLSSLKSEILHDDFEAVSFVDDSSGWLNMIKNHVETFASFQNLLPSECFLTTGASNTPSYHTPPTHPDDAIMIKSRDKIHSKDVKNLCKNAFSSLNALIVICEHLPKVCDSKESHDLFPVIVNLTNIAQWNAKTDLKGKILSLILKVLTIFVRYSKNIEYLKNLQQLFKIDILHPLLTYKSSEVQCCVLLLLISLVTFYPAFAIECVKCEGDYPSVLCHITDIIEAQMPFDDKSRYCLLIASLQFLSSLVSSHRSLLVEHSCFCDIYHGVDSLLYSQLRSWKSNRDGDEMRDFIIKSALCLLHSCVNVYPDSIPFSRRLHSHQFTMMFLKEYFEQTSDESSFWSVELAKIVETEAKTVLEEGDSA